MTIGIALGLVALLSAAFQLVMDFVEAGEQNKIVGLLVVARAIVKISALNRQLVDDELDELFLGPWKRGFECSVFLLDIGGLQGEAIGFFIRDKMASDWRCRSILVPLDNPGTTTGNNKTGNALIKGE